MISIKKYQHIIHNTKVGQLYESWNGWSYHLLLFLRSFREKKEVTRNIGWDWLNNKGNILFSPKPSFIPSIHFPTRNLQYAKMHYEHNEHLHIACKIASFVYSAGFLLFCFYFVMFRWQKCINASFSIVRYGVFSFLEKDANWVLLLTA